MIDPYLAPHLQGFLFMDLTRRRRERVNSRFAGGLAGATPLKAPWVHDLAGASRYNVKPPDHMEVCFARSEGLLEMLAPFFGGAYEGEGLAGA